MCPPPLVGIGLKHSPPLVKFLLMLRLDQILALMASRRNRIACGRILTMRLSTANCNRDATRSFRKSGKAKKLRKEKLFPFYLERAQGACKEKQPASCSVLATKRVSLGRYRCQRGCDTEARWSWCSQRRSRSMNNFCRTRHEESYLSGIIQESSNFLAKKKNPPTLALELQTTHHHDSYTKVAID